MKKSKPQPKRKRQNGFENPNPKADINANEPVSETVMIDTVMIDTCVGDKVAA